VAAACCRGTPPAVMARVLAAFAGVEHRMEFAGEVGGVRFVNDSKGTNPDAAIRALESYREPLILLAGGYDKGVDFQDFARVVRERVKHLVLLGETREKIAGACAQAGFTAFTLVESLEEAVRQAYSRAAPGDLVLLSPACASWDMFKSFEERGRRFKALVAALGGGEKDEKAGEKRP
jgi:UDP-N-acetylmuramoylalanine--D-glutamate ligase